MATMASLAPVDAAVDDRNRAIGDLVHTPHWVPAGTPVFQVASLFDDDSTCNAVAILDDDGKIGYAWRASPGT